MMKMKGGMWTTQMGSSIASFMFIWAMLYQYIPYFLRAYIDNYCRKLVSFFHPHVQITFHEFSGDRLKRSEAYTAIENYLSCRSINQAKRLKADVAKDSQSLVLSMDDHEEVTDEFDGAKLVWALMITTVPKTPSLSFLPATATDEKRCYRLTFHNRYREMVTARYLDHILKEGKAIGFRKRQRKLYTNNPSDSYKRTMWSHVVFEHPASFQTLAMDPKKKKEIKDDLVTFSKAKEYYARIGKAWKRGYLLYGPPGTGKSTMIAAIANFLNYDVYDLELTTVKDNTDLRKLLIETPSKSMIVIEDIDCSLDLTGQRKKDKKKGDKQDEKDRIQDEKKDERKITKVTLSGLLNFIDGIWSASGGERLIIFTTNHVDKLDPALIRRGRMDRHIEMSYCDFESFKVLAKNYLDLDSHPLFGAIQSLLEESNMTPADVSENLMPKSITEDAGTCLGSLIEALEIAKEETRKKAEEEAEMKAEKDPAEEEEQEQEKEVKEQET